MAKRILGIEPNLVPAHAQKSFDNGETTELMRTPIYHELG